MKCTYCKGPHKVKDCKEPLRERPMQEVLTKEEYYAALRFGIHPQETPTPKQKIVYDRAVAKLRRERRRQKQAMRRFLASAEKMLNAHGESLYGDNRDRKFNAGRSEGKN